MGLSGIHVWELLLVLLVVFLLFGTKKLPGIASDLGAAIRGFRKSLAEEASVRSLVAGESSSEQRRAEDDQASPPRA